MARRMLIDATHSEETRVAVVNGNRLEEFDFETASKQQLKGNIYLARVTRVEPSLQAAFVEYGGNRHGFLAFSEIHPDYYRIPIADREKLIAEAAKAEVEDPGDAPPEPAAEGHGDDPTTIEEVGGDETDEATERRKRRLMREYKIQEVIKRRQVMLVQVTKEERGNKGAALTTYLSLAGRYCVLMPNTPRGGGISRKVSNPADRKKMKAILEDLTVPEGMAVILRTAGVQRTKLEIRRDLDYLLRLWESIRELTLQSLAPTLIHEEANLIKRAIRDLYSRDIDEVIVEGDDGYKVAKSFMKMLMPSHARKVQQYRDDLIPVFHRYQVENQIEALHSPTVQLRSGGYIVINPTEALVAIDVNSGKATRERNIEETAYKTNLEAAEEVARQLRLRDMAGLIVIDFIDMEDDRHNSGVERRLKEAMKHDRARVQIGRISPFGLLELSRQRLRPSLVEAHFEVSPYCGGTGMIRTVESSTLLALRAIVEEGIRQRSAEIKLTVPTRVALYILNQKRDALVELEQRYGFRVMVEADEDMFLPAYQIERLRGASDEVRAAPVDAQRILVESFADEDEEEAEDDSISELGESRQDRQDRPDQGDEESGRRRRRRPKRRRGRSDGAGQEAGDTRRAQESSGEAGDAGEMAEASGDQSAEAGHGEAGHAEAGAADSGDESRDDASAKRRRRGRRGGRNRSRRRDEATGQNAQAGAGDDSLPADPRDEEADPRDQDPRDAADGADIQASSGRRREDRDTASEGVTAEAKPRRRRRSKKEIEAERAAAAEATGDAAATSETTGPEPAVAADEAAQEAEAATQDAAEKKPRRRATRARKPKAEAPVTDSAATENAVTETADAAEATPPEAEAAEPATAGSEAADTEAVPPKRRAARSRARKPKAEAAPTPAAEEPAVSAAEESASDAETPAGANGHEPSSRGNGAADHQVPARREQPADEAEQPENEAAAEAEVVNAPPERPRKGWWRRIIDN